MMKQAFLALSLAACSTPGATSMPDARPSSDAPLPQPDAGPAALVLPNAVNVFAFGIGDFAGDGSVILLLGGENIDQRNVPVPFQAVRIDRDGSLTDVSAALLPEAPTAVQARRGFARDLNGDGVPDFFSGNSGWDYSPWPGEHQTILISQPDHTQKLATVPAIDNYVHGAALGDLRKTGKLDIYVGEYNMTENVGLADTYKGSNVTEDDKVGPFVLRNQGQGVFSYDNVSLPSRIADFIGVSDGAPGRHTADAFVDIDNDGFPDFVAVSDESGEVAGAYWLNDGHGSFAQSPMHTLPAPLFGAKNTIIVDVVGADINHDGYEDLLLSETANAPDRYVGRRIQILMNDQHGNFVDETATRMPDQSGAHWAEFIVLGDFDGDGTDDIFLVVDFQYPLTPAPKDDGTLLWLNDGQGHYHSAPTDRLPPSSAWHHLLPVDFDHDGAIDFIDYQVIGYDMPIQHTAARLQSYHISR